MTSEKYVQLEIFHHYILCFIDYAQPKWAKRNSCESNQIYWNVSNAQNLSSVKLLIQHNSCHFKFYLIITGEREIHEKGNCIFSEVERLFATECSSIMCIHIFSFTLISFAYIVVHKYSTTNKTPSHFYFTLFFFFYRMSRQNLLPLTNLSFCWSYHNIVY